MEYLALALVFNTHNIYLQRALAVAIETTHFEVCMEILSTHTHAHMHTHREPYMHRHTYNANRWKYIAGCYTIIYLFI